MKNLSLLLVCALLPGCDFAGNTEDVSTQTTLPLKDKEWREINISEKYQAKTEVLELEHGWLVYREDDFSGGMAFVPKPEGSEGLASARNVGERP